MADCVGTLLAAADSSVRVLTDDAAVVEAVVEARYGGADGPGIDLLCGSDSLKQLERDFVVGSKASELVAGDAVTLRSRVGDEPALPTLVCTDAAVVAVIPVGGGEAVAAPVEAADARTRLTDLYRSLWAGAVPYSVDLPPYETMLSVAERTVGSAVREDFETAAGVVHRGDGEVPLKPVALAVVVGARHEAFVADITEWAETTGIASQGTVSNVKNDLREVGVVETDEVAHGVGRPRQRLRFADECFASLSVEELVATVRTVL